MHRTFKIVIGITASLAGLALFVCLAAMAAFTYFNSAPQFSQDAISGQEGLALEPEGADGSGYGMQATVRFEVHKGESAQSVGRRLAQAGLIRNQVFWYLLCRYSNEHIKIGIYRIEVPASQIAIHQILVSGKQILQRVTVPEGLTLKKTAKLLEEAGICSAESFLAAAGDPEITGRYRILGTSMEGYLYPDTYLFPSEYPAARVIEMMANTFFTRIGEIGVNATMPPEELNKLVILASIVEREYRMAEEAPVMAGVFLNRLDIGMALQSCATVEYVLTEIQGRPHPEVLTSRDLEIRDPYNTYIRPGLPPGPISAPGAVAIKAALFPEKTDYLYFRLVDPGSGRHYFSMTLDDHIKAGTLYVKGRL